MEAAAAFKHPRLRLGALLLRNGLLAAEQLAEALEEREQTGVRIGEIVVRRGWVSDEDLARTLAEQFAIDFVDLDRVAPDPAAGTLLPAEVARSVRAVPVGISDGVMVIAVADPTGEAHETLSAELELPVQLAVAPASAIERAIERLDPSGEEPDAGAPGEPDETGAAELHVVASFEETEPASTESSAPDAPEMQDDSASGPEAYSAIEWFEPPTSPSPPAASGADAVAEAAGPEEPAEGSNITPFELRRPLLGTLLLRDGLITPQQLAEALIEKEETEERLGEIVLRRGWISEVALSRLLAEQFAVVYVDLDATPPDDRAMRLLSAALARYFWAVPVRFVDSDSVLVAIADPTAFGVEDLERALGFRVVLGLATESAVEAAVARIEADEDALRPRPVESPSEPTLPEGPAIEDAPTDLSDATAEPEGSVPTAEAREEVAEAELPAWIVPSSADVETPLSDEAQADEPQSDDPATDGEAAVEDGPADDSVIETAHVDSLEATAWAGFDAEPETPVADEEQESARPPWSWLDSPPQPAEDDESLESEGEVDAARDGQDQQLEEPPAIDLEPESLATETPEEPEEPLPPAAEEDPVPALVEHLPPADETDLGAGEIAVDDAGEEPSPETAPELSEPDPAEPRADEIVEGLLRLAFEEGASDLHFEPHAEQLVVRARIDGIMQELYAAPAPLAAPLVNRLELIGGFDGTGERPRDELTTFTLDGSEIDARVTVAPTPYGEHVVLRFARAAEELALDDLGLAPDAAGTLTRAISRPYGAVIVAGPREGGTTTTLYAALRELDASGRCLMTAEDPIARPLPGIAQIQVGSESGLTFAQGLRTALASDPDVVLVGDIRDPETARAAVEAAVTGQLVLAAMRAEDIGGAVSRLIDMGVGRELLAAGTNALVAQRLARKLCPGCREAYDADVEELLEAGARESDLPVGGSVTLYRATGCEGCAGGYRGRVAMFETLLITSETRRLLETGTAEELHQAAAVAGMRTLQQDGLRLCLLGHTSLEEIVRVAGVSG